MNLKYDQPGADVRQEGPKGPAQTYTARVGRGYDLDRGSEREIETLAAQCHERAASAPQGSALRPWRARDTR